MKQGVLIYDEEIGRYDIHFSLEDCALHRLQAARRRSRSNISCRNKGEEISDNAWCKVLPAEAGEKHFNVEEK